MDPATLAADSNLELIEQRPFPLPAQFVTSANGAGASGEWRYVYRARADGVTDGLAMHAGDLLVVDVPSAESLRLSARIVRELAGEKLLGICVFRLPAGGDPATLNVAQVATALADLQSTAEGRCSPPVQRAVRSGRRCSGLAWPASQPVELDS